MRDDVQRFIPHVRTVLGGSSVDDAAWQRLIAELQANNVPESYALQRVQTECRAHLERFVRSALATGEITDDTVQEFRRRAAMLDVADGVGAEMHARLTQGHRLSDVRAGNLPTVRVDDVILDSDEQCHVHVPCHYERQLQSRVASVAGSLLLTNRKFRFIGYGDGWELPWNKILDVRADGDRSIEVYLTQKRGGGRYHVKDAEYVAVVIATLTRIAKRQLVGQDGAIDTPVVPQHIKAAVYRRDQGQCRECGSKSYLEFDHVIPRSRGGATSLNNLQLLCRKCNMTKGGRI